MLTKNMLLGVCVLLLAACALWWSVDRRSGSDVSLLPFRREVEEVRKEGGRGVDSGEDKGDYKALQRSIFANFREVADFLNKEAPLPAGDSLLLKSAEASENGPSMTYTYVVDGEMVVGMRAMEPVMRAVCAEPDMRDYMQYGVFYRYVYENAAGKVLMSFRVDEQTCKSLESPKTPKAPKTARIFGGTPVPASAPVENMPVLQVLPEKAPEKASENASSKASVNALENEPDRTAMDAQAVTRAQAVAQEPKAVHEAAPAGQGKDSAQADG